MEIQVPSQRPLAIVAGSGSGKSTLLQLIKQHYAFEPPISCTTRQLKETEKNGVHYYQISKDSFKLRIEQNHFLEWNEYYGNYYGTLYSEIERIKKMGKPAIFDVDINGAINLKKYDNTIATVFLETPYDVRRQRLISRGRDTLQEIKDRLLIGEQELARKNECEFVVPYGEGANAELTMNKIINLILIKEPTHV